MRKSSVKIFVAACVAFSLGISVAACGSISQPHPASVMPEKTPNKVEATEPIESMQQTQSPENNKANNGTDKSTFVELPEADTEYLSYQLLAEQLQDNQMICAAAFIGRIDGPIGDGYRGFIKDQGYLEQYDFIGAIPDERYIGSDGDELYCIVPTFLESSIAVNRWKPSENDAFIGEVEEVLYRSESGEPIILICSSDSSQPNIQINIVDINGNAFSLYPFKDQASGNISFGEYGGDVFDFSVDKNKKMGNFYFEQATPDSLIGEWTAFDVVTPEKDKLTCGLSFEKGLDENYKMKFFYGHPEGNEYQHFEGTYYCSNESTESVSDSMIVFDMKSLDANETHNINGTYLILYYPELKVIEVMHMDGDPLLSGMTGGKIEFMRGNG